MPYIYLGSPTTQNCKLRNNKQSSHNWKFQQVSSEFVAGVAYDRFCVGPTATVGTVWPLLERRINCSEPQKENIKGKSVKLH